MISCIYFIKYNCKLGSKCSIIHIFRNFIGHNYQETPEDLKFDQKPGVQILSFGPFLKLFVGKKFGIKSFIS